jgi:hypothetical protein
MRKSFSKGLVVLIILLSLVNYTWAGDSFSFSVSCSIPAVPGLNAPPLEEKTDKVAENISAPQDIDITVTAGTQSFPRIEESKEQIIRLVDGGSIAVATKTVYGR